MQLSEWTNWLSWPRLRTRRHGRARLLSGPCFREAVARERMRADRSGLTFSVLLLTPHVAQRHAEVLAELAGVLDWRLRATDTAGFWDRQSVGVLLPDTPAAGAWKVADDLLALWNRRSPIERQVYVYQPYQPSAPAAPDASHLAADPSRPAYRLEALLIQPLPRWKRAVDIAGALAGLVLLSPVMLATVAAIKLTSSGPVLFRQQRDGLGGKPFLIYKFRTMYLGAEARQAELRRLSEQDGPAFKLSNDPRITPLGRFLRRSCLDELPQLWNILRGQMSLVGPRPMDSSESRCCHGWQRERLSITPGMTCTWQVQGGSRVPFAQWMRMDIRYVRRHSAWKDFALLIRTLLAVLSFRASH